MDVQVFTTGGTIDKLYFDDLSEFSVGEPQVTVILRAAGVCVPYSVESLLQKDSLELTDDDRSMVRERVEGCPADHILITHGTDTMVKTGQVLQSVQGKTIVLTGSMQPARFRETDAIFNVGAAFVACQTLGPGVYIVMNGQVFDPASATKDRERGQFTSS